MDFQQQRRPAAEAEVAASLVALALVARKFGLHLDARRMMRDNQLSGGEVSPADVMRCAVTAGLRATGLRPGWHGLGGLAKALPAIVYFRDGGAMVLVGVERAAGGQRAVLQDPGSGEGALLSLDQRQFSTIWSGDLVLISAQPRPDGRGPALQPAPGRRTDHARPQDGA